MRKIILEVEAKRLEKRHRLQALKMDNMPRNAHSF